MGYVTRDNLKNAFVVWEKKQIIIWYGGDDPLYSSQIVHLNSDVVPSEADLHGSTYLVTRAWVAKVTDACAESGITLHIPRRKGAHNE